MEYQKDLKSKSGRLLQTRGPRDHQYTQSDNLLVVELRKQIDKLEHRIRSVDHRKQFTAEQMDDEIRAAAKTAIEETTVKYEKEIEVLRKELKAAREKLELKGEIIEILKSKTTLREEDFIVEDDRPKMKRIFIDPLESGAGDGLKSHIKVVGVSNLTKEDTENKIEKLKNLVGSFSK